MLKENLEFDFSMGAATGQEIAAVKTVSLMTKKLSPKLQEIHERACLRAKKYLIAEADLLESIIQVDRNKIYQELDFPFLSHYCEMVLNLTPEVAGSFIRVARKSHEIPALQKAVSEGLAITKAKTIVSVLKEENQEMWIEKAKTLSKHKLEKEVVRVQPKAFQPEKAKPVGENRNRLEFELSDEEMILQRRAQDLVSQKLGKSASLAETQAFLLDFFLKRQDPVEKANRAKARTEKNEVGLREPQKLIKKQEQVQMKKGPLPPKKPIFAAPSNTHRSRERSYHKNSSRRKALPAHVQHAVHERDQGKCQERLSDGKLCHQTRWTELHHVIPKALGGSDTPENLITLCSFHHKRRHLRN